MMHYFWIFGFRRTFEFFPRIYRSPFSILLNENETGHLYKCTTRWGEGRRRGWESSVWSLVITITVRGKGKKGKEPHNLHPTHIKKGRERKPSFWRGWLIHSFFLIRWPRAWHPQPLTHLDLSLLPRHISLTTRLLQPTISWTTTTTTILDTTRKSKKKNKIAKGERGERRETGKKGGMRRETTTRTGPLLLLHIPSHHFFIPSFFYPWFLPPLFFIALFSIPVHGMESKMREVEIRRRKRKKRRGKKGGVGFVCPTKTWFTASVRPLFSLSTFLRHLTSHKTYFRFEPSPFHSIYIYIYGSLSHSSLTCLLD